MSVWVACSAEPRCRCTVAPGTAFPCASSTLPRISATAFDCAVPAGTRTTQTVAQIVTANLNFAALDRDELEWVIAKLRSHSIGGCIAPSIPLFGTRARSTGKQIDISLPDELIAGNPKFDEECLGDGFSVRGVLAWP